MEEKGDLVNQLISNEGVCRTAPATPGLLNIQHETALNSSVETFIIIKNFVDYVFTINNCSCSFIPRILMLVNIMKTAQH